MWILDFFLNSLFLLDLTSLWETLNPVYVATPGIVLTPRYILTPGIGYVHTPGYILTPGYVHIQGYILTPVYVASPGIVLTPRYINYSRNRSRSNSGTSLHQDTFILQNTFIKSNQTLRVSSFNSPNLKWIILNHAWRSLIACRQYGSIFALILVRSYSRNSTHLRFYSQDSQDSCMVILRFSELRR